MAINTTAMIQLIDDFWSILGAMVGGFLTFLTSYFIELVITITIVGALVFLFKKYTKDTLSNTSVKMK